MPLKGRKGSRAPPLYKTEMEEVKTQLIIRETSWLGNLKKAKVSQIKLHSRWS